MNPDRECIGQYAGETCGHPKREHRKVRGKATLICFSAEPCGCQRFVPKPLRKKKSKPEPAVRIETEGQVEPSWEERARATLA